MTSQRSDAFLIAAVRGALDAGHRACTVAFVGGGLGLAACSDIHTLALIATLLAASAILGLMALWLSVRIAIDRRLFEALADAAVTNGSVSESKIEDTLPHLDHALTTLGWLAARNSGRPLHLRAQGVVRLMKSAVATAAAQWTTVCIIVTIAHLR